MDYISTLHMQLDQANSIIHEQHGAIVNRDLHIQSLEHRHQYMEAQIQTQVQEIRALRDLLKQRDQEIIDLTQTVESCRNDIAIQSQDLIALQNYNRGIRRCATQRREANEKLQQQFQSEQMAHEATQIQFNKQSAALESSKKARKAETGKLEKTIKLEKQQHQDTRLKLEGIVKQLNQIQQKQIKSESEIKVSTYIAENMKQKLQQTQSKLNKLMEQMATANATIKFHESEAQMAKRLLNKLKTHCEEENVNSNYLSLVGALGCEYMLFNARRFNDLLDQCLRYEDLLLQHQIAFPPRSAYLSRTQFDHKLLSNLDKYTQSVTYKVDHKPRIEYDMVMDCIFSLEPYRPISDVKRILGHDLMQGFSNMLPSKQ